VDSGSSAAWGRQPLPGVQAVEQIYNEDVAETFGEAPTAYNHVSAVVAASEGAGLCRKIARLIPIGVVKG
jgi:RNA-splicing ligase RtcB